jgi:hypothetical protein
MKRQLSGESATRIRSVEGILKCGYHKHASRNKVYVLISVAISRFLLSLFACYE